jgi:hypothetical protein
MTLANEMLGCSPAACCRLQRHHYGPCRVRAGAQSPFRSSSRACRGISFARPPAVAECRVIPSRPGDPRRQRRRTRSLGFARDDGTYGDRTRTGCSAPSGRRWVVRCLWRLRRNDAGRPCTGPCPALGHRAPGAKLLPGLEPAGLSPGRGLVGVAGGFSPRRATMPASISNFETAISAGRSAARG